ncbi:MAG: methyltransferase domain-containing protein [Rhodospirillaceae bacterium]|nr:methyltransferase domain-containing protein [Rhodospirillaceae bacterium]
MQDMVQDVVKARYGAGAQEREDALCCPVDYNPQYLKIIPEEVIERDYGCGDPSQYVRRGETVLDLGSGTGKICFIASQVVGPEGKVIGIDMTDEMLDVARRNAPIVAERTGYANVEFRKGNIEDLATDLTEMNRLLAKTPLNSASALADFEKARAKQRTTNPLVEDNSVDVIVSNCVLNLVSDTDKPALFREIFRVLKKGGRIAISDIVSDETSPEHLKSDDDLWSGCISGALQEHEFVALLEEVGFYGITLDKRDSAPWQVVDGIEYRSVTVLAWKGKEGPCWDKNEAVIYKGPFSSVADDDGHTYLRGQPMAVCEKTYKILTSEPYASNFYAVPAQTEVAEQIPFDCTRDALRAPSETKAGVAPATHINEDPRCAPETDCC